MPRLRDLVVTSRTGQDVYEARCHIGGPDRIFGGHVAAQALWSAGDTARGRVVAALDVVFLRTGDPERDVRYTVETLHDGRTYASRRVTARQGDSVLLTLGASFTAEQEDPPPVPVTDPPGLPPEPVVRPGDLLPGNLAPTVGDVRMLLREAADASPVLWVRSRDPEPSGDPLLDAAMLTYLTDMTVPAAVARDHEGRRRPVVMLSLNHHLWFHRPPPVETWLRQECDPPVLGSGRALVSGHITDTTGGPVAHVVQQLVARPYDPGRARA